MSYLNWHVGMKVVCVVEEDHPTGYPDAIVGEVYTIKSISIIDDDVMVTLFELPDEEPGYFPGFYAWIFRPVDQRKTSIEVFNRILRNPHVRIKEDA